MGALIHTAFGSIGGAGAWRTNLYAYAGDNPVNAHDPSGLDPNDPNYQSDNPMSYLGSMFNHASFTDWTKAFKNSIGHMGNVKIGIHGMETYLGGLSMLDGEGEAAEGTAAAGGAIAGKFPETAEEMNKIMGFEGERIPDVNRGTSEPLPGRAPVDWDIESPSGRVHVTSEKHPYDTKAPDCHKGAHWHVDWPGRPSGPHPRFAPGNPFP